MIDPTPDPSEPIADLRLDVTTEMRGPIRDGRLALIPLIAENASPQRYLTLRQAAVRNLVSIVDSGSVGMVTISSRAREPVFIPGGEIVIGGKQDRIVTSDVVVPAGATLSVATLCVEAGRWSDHTMQFTALGQLAEPALRRAAAANNQDHVWDVVAGINSREGVHGRGESYRFAVERQTTGANLARRTKLLAALDAIEPRAREDFAQVLGVAIAIDERVVAIERFPSAALWRDLRAMVIASYLPITRGRPFAQHRVTADNVRAFARKHPR